MPIAASGNPKDPMPRYYHHLLPKPPPLHGQLSPTLLAPPTNLFSGEAQACVQDLRQVSPPLNVSVGHQDSPAAHLFGTHTPPSLLNLSPGLGAPLDTHQRTSPSGYDLREIPQRRSFQELHATMNPQPPISPAIFSAMCAEDPGRKSESPSRKRRRVSISSHNVIDLTASPAPPTPNVRQWDSAGPEPRNVRRRTGSQRRLSAPERCPTPRSRRSPTIRRNRYRDRMSPWPAHSPDRRAFQPPSLPPSQHAPFHHGLGQQSLPTAPQGQPPNQQPILIDVNQVSLISQRLRLHTTDSVPVSVPLTLSPHNLPLYSGPHIPMGSTTHLAPCNLHTCASIQFPSCQMPQIPPCSVHLPPHHPTYQPLLHHHHHHHHHPLPPHGANHQSLPGQHPLIQSAQFLSQQPITTQSQEAELEMLSEHRGAPGFHSLPPGALPPGATLTPSPPLHLLQEPTVRTSQPDFAALNPYGHIRRVNQSRRTPNRRWRGPPISQTPSSYPGFLLHFLAMLSNPSVPAYGQDMASPETTEAENYEALLTLAERLGEAKPRGLLKAEIEQLPSYRFNVETHQSDQTSCVICMCDFEQRQLLRVLPCNHEFHAKCVDKWLKTNRTCPICRGDSSDYFTQPE